MADAAQLKLQVRLDLTFFRQQLAQLGTVAVGYQMPINIKLNPLAVQQELSRLKKKIGNTQYTVKINTNIENEINNADRLVKALQRVQREGGRGRSGLPVDIRQLRKTKGQGGFSAADIKTLFGAAIAGGLLDEKTLGKTREQMVTAFASIGKDSIEGLLNGLSSADASIRAAAESIGETLIKTTKASLGIRSPSKEFEEIGKNVGRGFEKGVLASMDAAFNALERKMQQRTRVLDAMARGIFHMLGMDPASMMAAERQKRLPPTINWPASTATPAQYQSQRGTMLAGAPALKGIGGTAFGAQKYLPTALGNETKKVLRDAAYVFLDTIKQGIREVRIQDLGKTINSQAMLSGRNIAGLLPPGVGRVPNAYTTGAIGGETQAERFARREREARIRSSFREMDVMGGGGGRTAASYNYAYRAARPTSAIIPYGPGGALVAGGGGGGGNIPPRAPMPPSGGGNRGDIGNPIRNAPNIQLPGAGLVREIGDQFGYAAKQVLLFGAAYRALAFLTDFPSKVGEAVGQLQAFNNTLKAITPSSGEFGKSNQFILDLVEKYNIPLQAARNGFTKLYASMAPAGFKGDEIRNIFTGISKGAATFGMSADKVDRVNYAFAQMASKGQVMSEELKGQLGDVLPGAVAIFAKAAGFKGPQAMVKFTKAMEDGRYKGEAMKQLLLNVGIVMNEEFSAGAEGASLTYQGAMNRMQNSTAKLYEAFQPVAINFANSIVIPLSDGFKVLTDGFNAFFTQTTAKTAGGNALAQQLNDLKPSFEGIQANLKQLIPTFQLLGNIALGVAKAFTVIAGNPITGFLLKVYANVLLVNTVFTVLGGKILVNLIGSISASIGRFIALNVAMASLQRTSAVTSSTLAGSQVQLALLSRNAGTAAGSVGMLGTALAGLLRFGLILIGINVVINGLAELDRLKQSLEKIGSFSSKQYRQEIKGMSKEDINSRLIANRATQAAIKKEQRDYQGLIGQAKGLTTGRDEELRSRLVVVQTQEQELIKASQTAKAKVQLQSQVTNSGIGAIPPSEVGGGRLAKEKRAAKIPLEQLLDRSSSRAAQSKAAALDLALNERILQAKKDGNEQEQASLENLRPAIKARGELAALTEFHNMLVRNEAKIVGKSLTQAQFKERLQLAGQKMTIANINLENEYVDLRKKDLENNKQILDQQEQYQRTLEDIKIKNGEISDEEVRRLEKLRQYQDILKANPGLTDLQKTDLFNAINAAPIDIIGEKLKAYRKNLDDMLNTKNQIVGMADAIGTSFGDAFKGIITGSMTAQEALAGFFQNLSNYFADMVSKMIADWLRVEAINGLKSLLGGLGGMFGGGGGLSDLNAPQTINNPLGFTAANGGIAVGGFRAFATGGIVTGPTLGLVGEGRYNEAVIPLPDGKSVPVDLGGMSSGMSGAPITVNVSVDAKGSEVQGDNAQGAALGRAIAASVQSELIKQKRPGGLLAK
jgi:tape measure domain-containing protein